MIDCVWLLKLNGDNSGIPQVIPWMFCGCFCRIIKQSSWMINIGNVREGEQINVLSTYYIRITLYI